MFDSIWIVSGIFFLLLTIFDPILLTCLSLLDRSLSTSSKLTSEWARAAVADKSVCANCLLLWSGETDSSYEQVQSANSRVIRLIGWFSWFSIFTTNQALGVCRAGSRLALNGHKNPLFRWLRRSNENQLLLLLLLNDQQIGQLTKPHFIVSSRRASWPPNRSSLAWQLVL